MEKEECLAVFPCAPWSNSRVTRSPGWFGTQTGEGDLAARTSAVDTHVAPALGPPTNRQRPPGRHPPRESEADGESRQNAREPVGPLRFRLSITAIRIVAISTARVELRILRAMAVEIEPTPCGLWAVAGAGNYATSPKGILASAQRRRMIPRGDSSSPRCNSVSPGGNLMSPWGRSASPGCNPSSPKGTLTSLRGRSISPRGDCPSPGGNSISPGGNAIAPEGAFASPRHLRPSPDGGA